MGKVLAEIHRVDKKYENEVYYEMSIDWDFYLAEMKHTDTKLYAMLKDALSVIQDSQNKGNQARKKLPPIVSICHNDMDCKNVLWNGKHRLTRAHREKQLKMSCQALHNAPPNRT